MSQNQGLSGPRGLAFGPDGNLYVSSRDTSSVLRYNGMTGNFLEAYSVDDTDVPHGGYKGWKKIDTTQRYPKPAGFPGPKFSVGWVRSILHSVACFVDNAANGRPGHPGLQQGIYIQHLIDVCRRSADSRSWIKV